MKHKRGGIYSLRTVSDVTNWCGEVLDKTVLNNLKYGDCVRVMIEPGPTTRYIGITHILKNGYFKGIIQQHYDNTVCNICRLNSDTGNSLYSCKRSIEKPDDDPCNNDYDFHLECLKKHPEEKKCDCKIERVHKHQSGETMIFKKNNISEFWCNERITKKYGKGKGYRFTGVR
jgi:hypothetical protein